MEIDALLSSGTSKKDGKGGDRGSLLPNVDIDEMYSMLCETTDGSGDFSAAKSLNAGGDSKEDFWREMEGCDDPFETICHFLSRGYIDGV